MYGRKVLAALALAASMFGSTAAAQTTDMSGEWRVWSLATTATAGCTQFIGQEVIYHVSLSQDGAVFTSWVDEYGKRHAIGGEEADQAVRSELAEAERRALALVKDHEGAIRALADALVEHETLDAAALKAVIKPAADTAAV